MDKEYIELITIKDKQKVLLYLFNVFHTICDHYNLIYNSFGGTMLGAVRHSGFIPWDDDIDVTMPRDDYNKFIYIVNKKYAEKYNIFTPEDSNYIYPYSKFGLANSVQIENVVKFPFNKLSINMDIFPVDGYPSNENEIDEYNGYEENIILCTYKLNPRTFIKHPKKLIRLIRSRLHGYKYYLKKQISLFSKNKIDNCDYLICQGAGWGRKGKILKDVYFDRQLYNFETIKVWGIKNYDEQMKSLYGDYMTLPPITERVSPHNDSVYIKKKIFDKIVKWYDDNII